MFQTSYKEIIKCIKTIDPIKYGTSRNYVNGSVTYLSPYISRGVISTKQVFLDVLNRGFKPPTVEKFIQELAWRDYWQRVWVEKKEDINLDLKHDQKPVFNTSIPRAITEAQTGIDAVDSAIVSFYKTGYLHNHLRMYIASMTCNIAKSHWKMTAKWMYYHLLDADWGSNALSWQWVAATNSNKKYYANQENINTYCFTNQKDTFLDVTYDALGKLDVPDIFKDLSPLNLKTPLPQKNSVFINSKLPTYLYNIYNLDPLWDKDILANRVLLLEPSHFDTYPVCKNTIDFIIKISKENISNIQIYIGEFHELISENALTKIHYKEHPLNNHYKGKEHSRDWMFEVTGYYPSFFSYWKACKKELIY